MKDRSIQRYLVLAVVHLGSALGTCNLVHRPRYSSRPNWNAIGSTGSYPGMVNGDGIMDTLHPGIAAVDTAGMMTSDADAMGPLISTWSGILALRWYDLSHIQ
jgi:hypothetical protein